MCIYGSLDSFKCRVTACLVLLEIHGSGNWYLFSAGRLDWAVILLGVAVFFSEHLCIFGRHGAIYIFKFFYIHYFIFSWAESGVIGPWPGWLTIVLCWPVKSSPKWLITGWALVWKTWKCQGIWHLSEKCQGFYEKSVKCQGKSLVREKLPKTVYCKVHICVHRGI